MNNDFFIKNSFSKFIEITGKDRVEFIQGLITNDIYKCKNDNEAILTIRELIQNISTKRGMSFSKIESKPPLKNINDIYGILPKDRDKPYEMNDFIILFIDEILI